MILKGKAATLGYKNNSPYKNAKSLTIDFGKRRGIITMKDVDFPLKAESELGESKIMYPNKNYKFKGRYIKETPMKINKQYRQFNNSKYQVLKHGGIIVGGVLHSEKNHIGDFGVPVVPSESYLKGGYIKNHKVAEIEKEELILNKETTQIIERLIKEYDDCLCGMKLVKIGMIIKEALKNVSDETCRVECKYDPILRKIK